MLQLFTEHIRRNFSFLFESKLLLAISGGIDSVVLAHLCKKAGLDFALAHCNFNLRGKESDADERFVRDLSIILDVPVFVESFDTKEFEKKQNLSTQMAARTLRYNWFNELSQLLGFQYVLTAHQADDNLETFLINLTRGTGIEGLTGIPPINGNVVRPMLPFSREAIIKYAEENKLAWREDSSNTETKYLRNKIRLEVVPKLKEINPSLLQSFQHTIDYLRGSAEILDKHLSEYKSILFNKENGYVKVPVAQLANLQPRKAYLHAFLKVYGFTEWNDIENLLFAGSGKQVFSATHRMLKDRDYLFIQPLENSAVNDTVYRISSSEKKFESPVKLSFKDVGEIHNEGKNIIYLDKETLKYPLTVRKWQNADYFYPFGMSGKKKVSKFFKDEKFSLIDKENQWLLCSQNEIVWVIGHRADNRFRVQKSTANIVKVQYHP